MSTASHIWACVLVTRVKAEGLFHASKLVNDPGNFDISL